MKKTFWAAVIMASVALVACQMGGSPTSAPPKVRMSSSVDQLSMRNGQTAYEALAAQGMVYSVSGRVSNITVSTINGKAHVSGVAIPGEYVQVSFIKGSHNVVTFDKTGQRGARDFEDTCDDCDNTGRGTLPPRAQQTKPPNYSGCVQAGGATWYVEATGDGGCLGPGASKGFPCGVWSFSAPGHGRYRSWDGAIDYDGFEFISLNLDGASCTLGPLS